MTCVYGPVLPQLPSPHCGALRRGGGFAPQSPLRQHDPRRRRSAADTVEVDVGPLLL